jgi:hypothetical protein
MEESMNTLWITTKLVGLVTVAYLMMFRVGAGVLNQMFGLGLGDPVDWVVQESARWL